MNIIATHENTDDEIVRKCVAILLENQEELANINPLFIGLNDSFTPLKSSGLPVALEFGECRFIQARYRHIRTLGTFLNLNYSLG